MKAYEILNSPNYSSVDILENLLTFVEGEIVWSEETNGIANESFRSGYGAACISMKEEIMGHLNRCRGDLECF